MPAQSKQQQKFMGIVHAIQKGELDPKDASSDAQQVAKDMKPSDVTDFASTPHKGLPKKVKQEILNRLKEYAGKMGRDHMGGDDIPSANKGGLRDFDGYDNVDYNRDMPQDEGNLPTNWLQGRVSDYHTKKGTTPREDYEDTNFNKDNSGQPDLEEGDLEDAIHQVKKFDKPKDEKLLTIKVINKLKDKRNKLNSSDNKEKLQTMIDKIEGDYKKGKFLTEASFHALNNPRMKNSLSNLVKDKKVENPETGRQVSVQTAVSNPEHPAHDKAVQIKKSLLQRLKGMMKNESINESELKLGVKYINKQGKEGFIQTGGSKNSKDWFWFDGKTKHPYDKVKKELKPSKDQKKTGFGDYLKQGGRVWDNVNMNGESITESLDVKKIHNDILKFLKTKKGVEIQDYSDFPNKYGDNVSTYHVKYDIEDKYNYKKQEIKIEYSTSRVFIPNKGYFPFKTFNDIKNIINKKSSLKESVNEGCWKGYKQVGGKMKNGRMVPNCVPESVNEELSVDEMQMVVGIIDILKQVDDKENRKRIVLNMIQKFKEEGIEFDYQKFVDALKEYSMGSYEYNENKTSQISEAMFVMMRDIAQDILPKDVFQRAVSPEGREDLESIMSDLKNTLNKFFKMHKINKIVK